MANSVIVSCVVGGTKVVTGMPVDIEVGPMAVEKLKEGAIDECLSLVCLSVVKCVAEGVACNTADIVTISGDVTDWIAIEVVIGSREF